LSPLDWDEVEVDAGTRSRILADGREMAESKLIVSKEMLDQMWQGYRCASCLEDLTELGAFPQECPLCHFPVKALQRSQLEQDFVGEIEAMRQAGFIDTELGHLERSQYIPKPQIHVPKEIR